MPIKFKDLIPELSEEHIKQICRFTQTEYVEGEWQKWRAYAEFKKWHYNLMEDRDELVRKIRAIERRSKSYSPTQSILKEYLSLKDNLARLQKGECEDASSTI